MTSGGMRVVEPCLTYVVWLVAASGERWPNRIFADLGEALTYMRAVWFEAKAGGVGLGERISTTPCSPWSGVAVTAECEADVTKGRQTDRVASLWWGGRTA